MIWHRITMNSNKIFSLFRHNHLFPLILSVFLIILFSKPILANGQDIIMEYQMKQMFDTMERTWAYLINPFGLDLFVGEDVPITYLSCLFVMYFIVDEFWFHSDAVRPTKMRGIFLVQSMFSGQQLQVLIYANYLLQIFLYYTGEYPSDEFLFDKLIPFMLIYFIWYDFLSYFQITFLTVKVRKVIVLMVAMVAADLNYLKPLMDTLRNIMMTHGITVGGGLTWGAIAGTFTIMIIVKFLKRVQASFNMSQRDYIQNEMANARHQMYSAMLENS